MTNDDRQDPAERKSAERAYPLDRAALGHSDHRFTNGLMIDLVNVLRKHGYPELTGSDLVDFFYGRVFGFLYGDSSRGAVSEAALVAQLTEDRPVTPRICQCDDDDCGGDCARSVPQHKTDSGPAKTGWPYERYGPAPVPQELHTHSGAPAPTSELVHAVQYREGLARTRCGKSLFVTVYSNSEASVTCSECRAEGMHDL